MSKPADEKDTKTVDGLRPGNSSTLKAEAKTEDGQTKQIVVKLSGKFYVNGK